MVHVFEDLGRVTGPATVVGARLGNRPRLGVERALNPEEVTLERREVEVVVVRAERNLLAVAVDDVDVFGPYALQVLEHLCVGAELQQKVRLRLARELRVDHLVTECAQLRGGIDAVEKVGVTLEALVTKGALV